jgi:hypothetical protein
LSPAHFWNNYYGWEQYAYQVPVVVDGITYCHEINPFKAAPPKYLAAGIVAKMHKTCVQGHAHRLDYYEDRGIIGLSAGCFFDYDPPWAPPQQIATWRRGIAVLHNVIDGRFDLEWYSIERIRQRYA